MAKSAKKASRKPAKKAAKKAVKKAPKKVIKKAAKKRVSKPSPLRGKKFLIIYHAPMDAMEQTANVSPAEQEAGMAQWRAWAERVGRKLLDLGAPLINGKRLNSSGSMMPSSRE